MYSAGENAEIQGGLNNAELINKDSFERLKSKKRRKEIRRKIFYLFLSLFLCAVVGVICVVFFFGLKDVEIRGNEKYSGDEILSVCEFDEETNLFGIDFAAAERRITERFPYIRSVTFKRALPSTLIITVTEDVPVWYTEIAGDWFVLSEDLRIISRYELKEEIELLELSLTYIRLPEVDYAVAGDRVRFTKLSDYDYTVSFLRELDGFQPALPLDAVDTADRYHITLYSGNGRYRIALGTSDNLEAKLRFVLKVMEEEFDDDTIASLNVEYLTSVIVLKQEEPFTFP